MSPARPAPDPAELLSHLAWVQRLARALVRDAAAAEDLAQETLRVTLEQPGGRVGRGAAMKAWLGAVARRLAVDRFRADRSRAARERRFAPHEATGPANEPFEIVARSVRQQRVAQAVHELAEPYRSTLLYRYLDELPTRDVAARMEVTEEVVRKRLERGLAQLRERLDREFGESTKGWAIALLSLPGVTAMAVKTKLAVAAIVLIAGALGWRALAPDRLRRPSEEVVAESAHAAKPSPPLAATPDRAAPLPPPERVEGARAEAPAPASVPTAPRAGRNVLHVRVVDRQGAACIAGDLACSWFERDPSGDLATSHAFETAITDAVTEVELPPEARSAELAASIRGLPPSSFVTVDALDLAATSRDVTIRVGAGAAPLLAGRILVDGVVRTPRGLRIELVPTSTRARVHLLDGRYEVDDPEFPFTQLFVSSEETVLREVDVPAGASELDLELATGRRVRLTVVERTSGAPLPGFELFVTSMAPTHRDLVRQTWRTRSFFVRTDRDGVVMIDGVAPTAQVVVRRDAAFTTTEERVAGGAVMKLRNYSDPLLDLEVGGSAAAEGDPIERRIEVDAIRVTAWLRGVVAPSPHFDARAGESPIRVRCARVGVSEQGATPEQSAEPDAAGAFAFACQPGGDYRVWVSRDQQRLSQVATVAVGEADPPPIRLAARAGSEVELRVSGAPAGGFLHLYVNDPAAVLEEANFIPTTGATITRRLLLDAPTWLFVAFARERGDHSGGNVRREIDPATTPIVEIDLGIDRARPLHLALSGAELPAESIVAFLPVAAHPPAPAAIVHCRGADGASPVAVAPGDYLVFLQGAAGLVAAVVTIDAAGKELPIELRFEVEAHLKADLGAGIALTKVGGVALDPELAKALELRFARHPEFADAESILLPADAEFTILE